MAKDILTRDIKLFRTDVTKIGFQELKNLLEGLFCFIKNNANKWPNVDGKPHPILVDLERKQTIIWKELQRRGIMTKEKRGEFMNWLYSKHARRVF